MDGGASSYFGNLSSPTIIAKTVLYWTQTLLNDSIIVRMLSLPPSSSPASISQKLTDMALLCHIRETIQSDHSPDSIFISRLR